MATRPFTSLVALRDNPIWQHQFHTDPNTVPDLHFIYNLTNPVHPLWRWKAWRSEMFDRINRTWDTDLVTLDHPNFDYPQDIYARLLPCLQLTTIFLARAAPLLIRLALGPVRRYPDQRGGKLYLDPMWSPSANDEQAFDDFLINFGPRYRILLTQRSTEGMVRSARHALTAEIERGKIDTPIICAIALDFISEITGESWLRKTEIAKAACFVHVAHLLIHELGHAIWKHRQHNHFTPLLTAASTRGEFANLVADGGAMLSQEPSVWPDNYRELGFAVERFLHGCDLLQPWAPSARQPPTPATPFSDGSWGLICRITDDRLQRQTFYPLTLATLSSFFNEHTWENARVTLWLWPQAGAITTNTFSYRRASVPGTLLTPIEDYWRRRMRDLQPPTAIQIIP